MSTLSLIESVDLERLSMICQDPFVYKEDVERYVNYYKEMVESHGRLVVTYQKKELVKGKPYGRFFPKKNMCATYMWSAIRSELFSENNWDIDIVNCHPSILLKICEEEKIKTQYLKMYIKDRSIFIDDLVIDETDVETYNNRHLSTTTKMKIGKEFFTSRLYGAGINKTKDIYELTQPILKKDGLARELDREISRVIDKILESPKYTEIVNNVAQYNKVNKKKPNPKGSTMSFILGERESQIIYSAIDFLISKGFNITAYIYDGFHVQKDHSKDINLALSELNSQDPLIQFISKDFCLPLKYLDYDQPLRTQDECLSLWNSLLSEPIHLDQDQDKDILVATSDYEASKIFLEYYGDKFIKCDDNGDCCLLFDGRQYLSGDKVIINALNRLDIKKQTKDVLKPPKPFSSNITSAKLILESVKGEAKTTPNFIRKTNDIIKDYMFYDDYIFSFKDKKFYKYEDLPNVRPFFILPIKIGNSLLPIDDPQVVELISKAFSCFRTTDGELEFVFKSMARAISGHYEDKIYYIMTGLRDSGKGVFQTTFQRAFGQYIGSCEAPICKSGNVDEGQSNRPLISLKMNMTRISFSNESKSSSDQKPLRLDGNRLKKWHSGGDDVIAREHFKGEVTTYCNSTCVYAFNSQPESDPEDALETAYYLETPFKFTDGEVCGSNLLRKKDPELKDWIQSNANIPLIMLSIMSHYWSSIPFPKSSVPKSFQMTKDNNITLVDPIAIFKTKLILDEGSMVEKDIIIDIFSDLKWSDKKITHYLTKEGVKSEQIRTTDVEKRTHPDWPPLRRVYKGVRVVVNEE